MMRMLCDGTARRLPRPIVRRSGCRSSMSQPKPSSKSPPFRMGCTRTRADGSRCGRSRRPSGPVSRSSSASLRVESRALSYRSGPDDRASVGPTTPRSPKGARSRISENVVAIITDHEILPLVWTRDAYYICRALLSAAPRETRARAAVDGFIRWLFEVAERPDAAWPRASLASGQAKDVAFQLDQQLYPLLLVADHARLTGENVMRERYGDACGATLDELLGRRSTFGLVPTAEPPADDPLRQPYHFSSHVLLWHVLRAFSHPSAEEIRAATLQHFAVDGRFAYAVTGPRGEGARHYHDANDLPTVFAPGWGFCDASEPLWRETIAFAWSEANEGYFPGKFGGLGSLHTPRPWTLGDLQEIVVARVTADRDRESRARERLARVETWDGLLAEAYDEDTGAVAASHWFGWPTALRALLDRDPMLTAP